MSRSSVMYRAISCIKYSIKKLIEKLKRSRPVYSASRPTTALPLP